MDLLKRAALLLLIGGLLWAGLPLISLDAFITDETISYAANFEGFFHDS